MDIAALADLLHETPSTTPSLRQSPRLTTGGTGTPHTWMPAKGGKRPG